MTTLLDENGAIQDILTTLRNEVAHHNERMTVLTDLGFWEAHLTALQDFAKGGRISLEDLEAFHQELLKKETPA